MSKLNIDQVTVMELFMNKKSDFLIPNYQRPYSWEESECQTLWDDIFAFAIPNDDCEAFDDSNDEYFLGPIVTFKNEENKKQEIIDGQQRLTTLMLLLRAFYAKFRNMQDKKSTSTRENIEKCIWKTNEFGEPNKNALKIDSDVATDDHKEEFLSILKNGIIPDSVKRNRLTERVSNYVINYEFFQKKIDNFLNDYPSYFPYLPTRILNNVILLPIEAENQDTALRIFSTLNDRGRPLSDSDIFKAQFYKFYSDLGKKDWFIKEWKELEALSDKIFKPIYGTPMDELFSRYMYYERARQGIKSSTTEALRKFYDRDKYKLLKSESTFNNLKLLLSFWEDVTKQEVDRFTNDVLRKLFVLNFAPNSMWTNFVSVYFMHNKDEDGNLCNDSFSEFLTLITAFIWTYAITNPGVNALRTPVYAEMVNIVEGKKVTFNDFRFDEYHIRNSLDNFSFYNGRPITKSLLAWWAFNDSNQYLIDMDKVFEIEHIFARNRQTNERSLHNPKNLDSIGNKSLLEKKINIRASDYRFEDKKKYYLGFTNSRGQEKGRTCIYELEVIANTLTEFNESDIEQRKKKIIDGFVKFLNDNDLVSRSISLMN